MGAAFDQDLTTIPLRVFALDDRVGLLQGRDFRFTHSICMVVRPCALPAVSLDLRLERHSTKAPGSLNR